MQDRVNTVIIGLAIVISMGLLSSSIKSYGHSLERAAQLQRPNFQFPSSVALRVQLESGNSPIRIQQVD
jgi:hypothetical protein